MSVLKENIRYHAILYLISPVLGLIYGIRSKSWVYIRWSIFVFTVIYGSLFTIELFGGEIGVQKGADGARHLSNVYTHYQYLEFSVWWDELIAILSFDPYATTKQDPFIHTLSYIIGGIFNAPGLFFIGVAIVFGYFFSGAIVKLLSYVDWKSGYNKLYFLYFLVLFCIFVNPADMQTVRTWTGMWVLIYAVISYHQTKKKKYMLLALTPVLIHVGYFALAIPIWLVLFSGFRNTKVYFIIFIVSVFTTNAFDQFGLASLTTQTEVGSSKTDAYYLDDDRAEKYENERQQSQTNFYKRYEEYGIQNNALTAMVIFIFIFLRKYGFSEIENTLFSYALATASFANFFTLLFAVHNRSWIIAGVFILALMIIFLSKQDFRGLRLAIITVKLPLFLFVIFLFPFFLFKISSFIFLSSAFTLVTPFISWIDSEIGISIRDLIVFFI